MDTDIYINRNICTSGFESKWVKREDLFTWLFSRDVDILARDRKGLGTLDSVSPAWSCVGETCRSQSGRGTTVNTHKPFKPKVSDSNAQMDSSQVVLFITSCTITIDTNVLQPLTRFLNSPLLRVTIVHALVMHRCTGLPKTLGTKKETSDRGLSVLINIHFLQRPITA